MTSFSSHFSANGQPGPQWLSGQANDSLPSCRQGVFRVLYQLNCPKNSAEDVARDIALEQTVEVPESLITDEVIWQNFAGQVVSVRSVSEHVQVASIEYHAHLASGHLAQLMNLLFGNVSLKPGVRLLDVEFPESFLNGLAGPKLGIEGLRSACGVWERPLLATAIKPKGSSVTQLAQIAGEFAAGGGDLVKDDHNLAESTFDAFRARVEACQQAVLSKTPPGQKCLYFPNLSGTLRDLERQAAFCVESGIRGVLVAPMIAGLETIRHLSESFPLAILAHPTMSGSFLQEGQGLSHAFWLSTMMRLCGCDGTVFPNTGGRFSFSQADCLSIADAARKPLGRLKSCFPAPAGGMSYASLPGMARDYGPDTIFLVGGGLLGYSENLADSTAAFRSRIEELFLTNRASQNSNPDPRGQYVSSCELPAAYSSGAQSSGIDEYAQGNEKSGISSSDSANSIVTQLLKFLPGYRWEKREVSVYKPNAGLPFAHVDRQELIGKFGESTAFDVRYFELAPGGYSSREKHFHTHVVIPVRGQGQLECQGQIFPLHHLDIAYVPPLAVHQLSNPTDEPFGFLCIVDHDRDAPMAP